MGKVLGGLFSEKKVEKVLRAYKNGFLILYFIRIRGNLNYKKDTWKLYTILK
jgi:hypothetical protein